MHSTRSICTDSVHLGSCCVCILSCCGLPHGYHSSSFACNSLDTPRSASVLRHACTSFTSGGCCAATPCINKYHSILASPASLLPFLSARVYSLSYTVCCSTAYCTRMGRTVDAYLLVNECIVVQ